MPDDALADALHAVSPLPAELRAELAALTRTRALAPGEHWLSAGATCDHVALVRAGIVRYYWLRDGEEVTSYFVAPGGLLSDYASFLTRAPAEAYLAACAPTELAVLHRADVAWAYAQGAAGERLGRRVAEHLFVATHRRLASFYLENAEARYRRLLAEQPELVAALPQHLLASYVGVRAPSLSRIRARLARGGDHRGAS